MYILYIQTDGIPDSTFSYSGGLKACNFVKLSRSNFFMAWLLSHMICIYEKVIFSCVKCRRSIQNENVVFAFTDSAHHGFSDILLFGALMKVIGWKLVCIILIEAQGGFSKMAHHTRNCTTHNIQTSVSFI
jgi:hypothetical protein